ncbi:MAG: DUF418 domain-containing protein [Bacteroidales bacterium]|nr:DUF418 domain-containing protein [Bacteroidales bacterium]
MKDNVLPISSKQRYISLDAMRGLAIMGICLANYPEFSLYSFLSSSQKQAVFGENVLDNVVRFLQYLFVDGKFYTIFSILFGLGFSIIINNLENKGANVQKVFLKRMFMLLIIGFLHLKFLWSGDILMLYALMGMILLFFRRLSDKNLIRLSFFFLILPVGIELFREVIGFSLAMFPYYAWQDLCAKYNMPEEHFAQYLHNATSYKQVYTFLVQGSVERIWEFVESSRYFKVLGLFLFGFWLGKNKIYANIDKIQPQLKKIVRYGIMIFLPLNILYAVDCMAGQYFSKVFHSLLYFISVYPLGITYMAIVALLYNKYQSKHIWTYLSSAGRMALSCYILQSIIGIFLFYGIGFAWGGKTSLFLTEIIAICVFVLEVIISFFWFKRFAFGPLEWVWRCFTYGKHFSIMKK